MPAKERRNEVGSAKDVEAARENGPSNTIESGEDPGNLRLVNGEVGGYGAVTALGDEDGVGVAFGDCLRWGRGGGSDYV